MELFSINFSNVLARIAFVYVTFKSFVLLMRLKLGHIILLFALHYDEQFFFLHFVHICFHVCLANVQMQLCAHLFVLVCLYTHDMIKESICLLSGLNCALKANYSLIYPLSHVVFSSIFWAALFGK